MRTIALVVETPAPKPTPDVRRPITGPLSGVLYGAGRGFVVGAHASADMGRGLGSGGELVAVLWIAFSAVTLTACTVGGGLAGPFLTMPRREVERRARVLDKVLLGARIETTLESDLRQAVRAACPAVRIVWTGATADADLHVRLVGYGLAGIGGFDPNLSVVVHTHTYWLCDGAEHRADFVYLGPKRSFVHWSDHASELRDELRRACDRLAARIVDERLLVEVVR